MMVALSRRRRFQPGLEALSLRIAPSDLTGSTPPSSMPPPAVTPMDPSLIGYSSPAAPVSTPMDPTLIGYSSSPPND
jgi:hypothetical protein